MSGRINLKSVRLKTAQKYSNWLLFYLFFQKQAPFSVPSHAEEAAEAGGVADFQDTGDLSASRGLRHLSSSRHPSVADEIQIYRQRGA